MPGFEHGPVELYLIGFDGERPGPEVVDALLDLNDTDTVRLLDLLFVTKTDAGDVTVIELDEVDEAWGLSGIAGDELGLAGEEDVEDLADAIEPGTSAALLLVEHLWVRSFAEALDKAGGKVLVVERIPAPVVNELAAANA
jgi:uncharacterized membrane protein